jgi:hypothetical protein
MKLQTLLNGLFSRPRPSSPGRRRNAQRFAFRPASLGPEVLEERKLMAVAELADAALLVGHTHPGTHLYINFDGGTAPTDFSGKNFVTIRPFETEANDGALNRGRDIEDILFQVAEVYSPFDVQVQRIYGSGAYSTDSGNTTVFVGGNEANYTYAVDPVGLRNVTFTKNVTGFTPAAFADGQTINHEINTHPYDIGFVDPVGGTSTTFANLVPSYTTETQAGDPTRANIFDIRRSIAHEAGHTFGLEHVRSDGLPDPKPLGKGTVQDIQAYDAPDVFFANQSVPLTTANNTPSGVKFEGILPAYHDAAANQDVTLKTENSYRTLGRVLGFRPQNQPLPLVSDIGTVDKIAQRKAVNLSGVSRIDGYVGSNGDHQVFQYSPSATAVGLGYDRISVQATFGDLRPELLVYDAGGLNLISVVKPSGGVATLTNLKAGPTYLIVVGAVGGDSTGAYIATIEHRTFPLSSATFQPHPTYSLVGSGTSTTTTAVLTNVPHLAAGTQADTTGTTLDLSYVYRPRSLVQVQAIKSYTSKVAPADLTPPTPDATIPDDPTLVVDATADSTAADDLTVVVDTTVVDDPAAPAPADPEAAPIDDAAGDVVSLDLVAMATDPAPADLTDPASDDGTGLLYEFPTVASILSNV